MTTRRKQEGTKSIPGTLHVPEECRQVSEVLQRIGDKWTVLVVGELGGGPKRFNEIRRSLGSISQRMLTVFPTVPPRVDYELTKLGYSLLEPVNGLGRWARQNQPAIQQAQERFDTTGTRR